jgi:transposase
MDLEQLRQRVINFHTEEGVSYKYIAGILNINSNTFYSFTNGNRSLSETNLINLDHYLKERGY